MTQQFWEYLQRLVDTSQIVLDRPKGSTHPRYSGNPYPVGYGYLAGTTTMDAGGVDIWVGSLNLKRVVGALCTVDLLKRDTELKILYDCTVDEILKILQFINQGEMRGFYVKRDQ